MSYSKKSTILVVHIIFLISSIILLSVFGMGDPLFAIATRELMGKTETNYASKSNHEIFDKKEVLFVIGECANSRPRIKDENQSDYVERINNNISFDCFATNDEIKKYIVDFANKNALRISYSEHGDISEHDLKLITQTLSEKNLYKIKYDELKNEMAKPSFFDSWIAPSGKSWFYFNFFVALLFWTIPVALYSFPAETIVLLKSIRDVVILSKRG